MVKKCVVCGKEFEGHGLRKYCSDGCRRQGTREIKRRYRSENKERVKENHRRYRLRHKEKLREKNRRYYLSHKKAGTRKCAFCGKAFKPGRGTGYKYCSDECRKAMKKVYSRRQWEMKRKKEGCLMSNGNVRFTKSMVKAPLECKDQVTCLTCTRERCVLD